MEKKWPSDQTMEKAANDLAKMKLHGDEAAWQRLYKTVEGCMAPLKAKNKTMWWLVTLQMQVRAPLPVFDASLYCIVLSWHNPATGTTLYFRLRSDGGELWLETNGEISQRHYANDDNRDGTVNCIDEYLNFLKSKAE